MEKIKNYVIIGLVILLLLSGAGNIMQRQQAELQRQYRINDMVTTNSRIAVFKAEKIGLQNKVVEQQRSIDSIRNEHLITQLDKSKAISALRSRIIPPGTFWIIDHDTIFWDAKNNRPIYEQIVLRDSTIDSQDELIADHRKEKKEIQREYNELLEFQQMLTSKSDSLLALEVQAKVQAERDKTTAEQQAADERGKNFGFTLNAGWGAMTYDRKIVTGPVISASLSWSPPWARFRLGKKK